jgi:beta-galactosidase GanA
LFLDLDGRLPGSRCGERIGVDVRFSHFLVLSLSLIFVRGAVSAQDAPHIAKKDGRFALVVDGKPYLMLGAQINNSSAWASSLPQVWPALDALHVNTVEAPIYWEQMEPEPGKFDFSTVDLLVNSAREHKVRLVLLWFGTWKNGQDHYIPEWMKSDLKKYPREISAYGKVLDVLSPNSANNL